MKTPEEIKKGLECCSKTDKCPECPYVGEDYCATKKNVDALAYIRQLESNDSQVQKALQDNGFHTLEELLQAYSQVKRERDAAVEDMKKMSSGRVGVQCGVCKHRKNGSFVRCERCRNFDSWEWRGVQEKEE